MNKHRIRFPLACGGLMALAVGFSALAQQAIYKAPTASDWAGLAKLPDFSGVWERGGGGGGGGQRANQNAAPAGGRGTAAPPRGGGGGGRGGPSFTPKYEALRAAAAKAPPREDNETANCLPPGMPGIMGQP